MQALYAAFWQIYLILIILASRLLSCTIDIFESSYLQQKGPEENLQDLEGCQVGLEPTTFGTTIRHSNQLNYWHHVYLGMQR